MSTHFPLYQGWKKAKADDVISNILHGMPSQCNNTVENQQGYIDQYMDLRSVEGNIIMDDTPLKIKIYTALFPALVHG